MGRKAKRIDAITLIKMDMSQEAELEPMELLTANPGEGAGRVHSITEKAVDKLEQFRQ